MDYSVDLYPKIPFYMTYPMQNMYLTEMEYEKHDIEINLQTNTVLFTIAEGIYKHQYNITPNILEEIIADKIILLNCLYGEQ
mgnify:CR=1 FL=1